jgi:phage-related protein
MSLQTLPIEPNAATSSSTKARVLMAEFGDGYSQRGGDGIHTIKQEISATWTALDTTAANTLISFFEAHEGYIAFLWTPFRETTPKKFICMEWNESYNRASLTTVNATLQQVFDEGVV